MRKILILLLASICLAVGLCSCNTPGCEHFDNDDDGKCDECGEDYTDGCDTHRDADDDGKCDNGGEDYTDGCDTHRDADDNGKCDNGGEDYTDGCETHRDADDDGKCDNGGEDYTDGCETHRDADDNGKCDNGGEDYTDGCDNHADLNGDGKCDNGGEAFVNPLDGKKILFIGNSFTYYGQTVLEKSQSYLTQQSRRGDVGYFYQLCRANGVDVEVTNWTFGGHSLEHLFGGNCSANRGCDGVDHKAYLTDKNYDYVVVQPGSGATSSASFLRDMEQIMAFFRDGNPNVKFVVLVPYSAYGTIGSTITLATEFLNGLKEVAAKGVIVVDWGKVVMDIMYGRAVVSGSSLTYSKNTFVISKSAKDGYHPNQLSGYITTLMTYAAITGTNPVGQSYSFCNDSSLRPEGGSNKFFSFQQFKNNYYTYNGATTNFTSVFASSVDMAGIQNIIKATLEEKAYLNYNLTGNEDFGGSGNGNAGGEAPDAGDGMTMEEAVAAGYVAMLVNGGKTSYLTISQLEEKIKEYANGDTITLLTNVTCKGTDESNTGTSPLTVKIDLNAKTLTLTEGSILRVRNNDVATNFTLYSSNGKGTVTMAAGNDSPVFIVYRNNKTVTIGSSIGYTDGDVVAINAASLLYVTARGTTDCALTSITFYGGEYNQTASVSGEYGFIEVYGRNDGTNNNYFAGRVNFIGAEIKQSVSVSSPIFKFSFMFDENVAHTTPQNPTGVPGITLSDCKIYGFSNTALIHNMETVNSVIYYNNCEIVGDIMTVGADSTDEGLGKVVLGEGTLFSAANADSVKAYDAAAITTYDGSTSGIYLAEGTAVFSGASEGEWVVRSEEK